MGLTQLPQIGGGALKDFDFKRRSSGNITVSGTAWANIDTGIDIILNASTGDVVEVGASFMWSSETRNGVLDVASIVGGVPVNYWGRDGAESALSSGINGWWGHISAISNAGGSVLRTLLAADISAGIVTLRLRGRTFAAGTKTIFANSDDHFTWFAKNLGPVP